MPRPHALARPERPARWLLAILTLLLGACAQLPEHVDRPVSRALDSSEGTPLAALTQSLRRSQGARAESGFYLLEGASTAYSARLALVAAAQRTLDLQYYAIHADASSARLLRGIREAAARGVRVRILLDDFHSVGRDALVMQLAFEHNIEMRMFNPLPGARASVFSRLFNALDDAADLQQRMHNKLFIADNAMAITGGRNLGDEYFGNGRDGNFLDLDVLSAGPVVRDFSRSFDAYWNNQRAYPVPALVSREELAKIRERERKARERQARQDASQGVRPDDTPVASETPEAANQDAATRKAQRRAAWEAEPLDLGALRFQWAPAIVLADQPGKIALDGSRENEAPPAAPAGSTSVVVSRGAVAQRVAASASPQETVVDGLLQLFGRARSDLHIISPYFVPGPDMLAALSAATQRGVRVRVLTNSMASNDALAAHAGYARHRQALLAAGIELYELRSEGGAVGGALGSAGGSTAGSSRSMLHSKALTLDGQLVVVGSMNLDLRSQLQNTEVALLVHSAAMAQEIEGGMDTAFRRAAWHVEMHEGRLVWRAPPESHLPDSTTEPDTSAGLRLMLRLLGPLAPDKLL